MLGPVGVEGTLLGRSFTGIERRPLVSAEAEPRSYFYDFYVYVRRLKVEFLQYTFERCDTWLLARFTKVSYLAFEAVCPCSAVPACEKWLQSAQLFLQGAVEGRCKACTKASRWMTLADVH